MRHFVVYYRFPMGMKPWVKLKFTKVHFFCAYYYAYREKNYFTIYLHFTCTPPCNK